MSLESRALAVAIGVAAISAANLVRESSPHGHIPPARHQPTAARSGHDARNKTYVDFPIVQARQAALPPG